ncbi:putative amidohydrolase [Halopolyspora algeriensis]|uniref:Putative amidohydrolase n=1 Tax=Halopolyspora algeriensis TaxID=1500506 RepID=A0A368VW82_9ACTN|nr:carbon-nitrogen hydrolase family protein [Halopolyspora algeriensis]RCW46109.1 putative amidohydrolase [Halopolyspora algeriensis]TQM55512.1 putative amidohydrolase [Halopolyspora algeriensis]
MNGAIAGEHSPTIRAAAIQLQGVVGDVAENVRRLEVMIDEAAGKGATLIGVPEFATSPLPFRPEVHQSVLTPQNAAVEMLQTTAKRHGCHIGGSMLIADGGQIYNRYHLVEPDGQIHLHDKDLPTMWENAFYAPGHDDGAFETSIGRMGAAVCWELIRTRTVRRLLGRVDVVMTGTHWWTLPSNWGRLVDRTFASLAQFNRYLSENAPAEFARRVGTPVLQASHCGPFRSDFMLAPGLPIAAPYDTEFVGATQIVDADGHVLAARNTAEGPGVVVADIELGAREPVQPLKDTFWIPKLPLALRAYWHHQNMCAKPYYRKTGRAAGLRAAEANLPAESDETPGRTAAM